MSQDVFSFEYHELIILSSRFQHANMVRQKCLDLLDLIAEGKTKQRPPTFEVPERELPCRFNVQPTTWFARDNVFNFILFCRRLGKLPFFLLPFFFFPCPTLFSCFFVCSFVVAHFICKIVEYVNLDVEFSFIQNQTKINFRVFFFC